tara:strand:+ start:900 stop:1313 length:414 start_codon:yes stop_codon:yes gene_type:complete
MKTEKRLHTDRCQTCNQLWTREIDVEVPNDGIVFYVIHSKKNKIDLTIDLIDVPKTYNKNGHTDVYSDLTFGQTLGVIQMYARKYHKDNTFLRVESNFMDTYEIRDRRIALRGTEITDALKTLKKQYRQGRVNRQVS